MNMILFWILVVIVVMGIISFIVAMIAAIMFTFRNDVHELEENFEKVYEEG